MNAGQTAILLLAEAEFTPGDYMQWLNGKISKLLALYPGENLLNVAVGIYATDDYWKRQSIADEIEMNYDEMMTLLGGFVIGRSYDRVIG